MRFPFWRRRKQEELNEEIQSHLGMAARDRIQRGETVTQAQASVDRDFGNAGLIQDVTRDQWGWRWLEDLSQDVHYGLRMLRKSPGFAAVAVLTLAIGIGANTAIFSVINALVSSLPYPHPDRLVRVCSVERNRPGENIGVSWPDLQDWKQRSGVFENMDASNASVATLIGTGNPRILAAQGFTSEDFKILNVAPELGRTFVPGEDRGSGALAVILSDALWQKSFGRDPKILGKSLRLDDSLYTVIGVMPPRFDYPNRADVWLPFGTGTQANATMRFSVYRTVRMFQVIARLKEGETLKQAQAQMDALARVIEHEHPDSNQGFGVRLVPLQQDVIGNIQETLLVLFGAAGFVLLIACANVANLSLARGAGRRKEIAVRLAMGSSQARLCRQLLTESTLLSLLGASAGLALAIWMKTFLIKFLETKDGALSGSEGIGIPIDFRVLSFTILVALAASVVFGLLPALRALKTNPNDALKEIGRGGTAGLHDRRVQGLLVVAETALALVLLTGAVLLIQSFTRVLRVDMGFSPTHVLAMEIFPDLYRYPIGHENQRIALVEEVMRRLRQIPGVQSVAVASAPPMVHVTWWDFEIEGHPPAADAKHLQADFYETTPGYFETMGIPVLQGHDFTPQEGFDSPRVAIVSQEFARRYFGGHDVIGKRLNMEPAATHPLWAEIVGVVGDVKTRGLDQKMQPSLYMPFMQGPDSMVSFVFRVQGDSDNFKLAAQKALWFVDPEQPITRIYTMNEILKDNLAARTITMFLLVGFAAVALALAAIGIFGVMSYSVAQRTHEIGIRVALGARKKDVLQLIIGHGVRLALVGVAIGMSAALALTRLISSMLFGVSDKDPIAFVTVALLLLCVALAACYIPARRAMRVDPMVALRYE